MPEQEQHSSGEGLSPETGAAPSREFLDRLYRNFLGGLSEFVGLPLKDRPSVTIRGIVRQDSRSARIFLLPDSDFISSFAVDVPLVNSDGSQYNHFQVATLLRSVVAGDGFVEAMPMSEVIVGKASINVFDARESIDSVVGSSDFEGFVRATLYGLVGSRQWTGQDKGERISFAGFMILDESRVRYYFDLAERQISVGIDCALHSDAGRKREGGVTFLLIKIQELFDTGVMETLLVPGFSDDYCQVVYDVAARV